MKFRSVKWLAWGSPADRYEQRVLNPVLLTSQLERLVLLFFFLIYLLFICFIFGCVGSSLLRVGFFFSCGEWGLLFIAVHGLSYFGGFSCRRARALGAQASVVVALRLWSTVSVVVAHGLSCSTACGIFLDQGLNPCPLHCHVDS